MRLQYDIWDRRDAIAFAKWLALINGIRLDASEGAMCRLNSWRASCESRARILCPRISQSVPVLKPLSRIAQLQSQMCWMDGMVEAAQQPY